MKYFKIIFPLLLLALVALPLVSFAHHGGLVPCGYKTAPEPTCTLGLIFDSEKGLIKHIIDFALLGLIIPIATISIAIAGFRFIISGDKPEQRSHAKEILIAVAIGIVIAFGAWLIINTVLSVIKNPEITTPLKRT